MKVSECPIGDFVEKCQTWNPKTSGAGSFDYIDLSSVDKDTKSINSIERYECSDAPSRARQLVETGDVLVATVRPNLNGVALVNGAEDGMTASTGYCVLRPKDDKLDSRYLFHWVKTGVFVKRMVDVATGANYPAVSDAKVKTSTIPLPPLAEQKRIAAILDAADALRAKRRESLEQLDTLLQSTFLEMFGDPNHPNPVGSHETQLVDMGSLTNIQTGKLDANAADLNGRFPFFTCASETLRINTAAYDAKAVLVAGNGDLNVKYYEGQFNAYQRTYIIESKDEQSLVPRFLHAFLEIYVTELRKQAIGGVIKYIKLPYLKDAMIPLPRPSVQNRFASIVESVEQQKAAHRNHLEELDTLFAALQQRAFQGEL